MKDGGIMLKGKDIRQTTIDSLLKESLKNISQISYLQKIGDFFTFQKDIKLFSQESSYVLSLLGSFYCFLLPD